MVLNYSRFRFLNDDVVVEMGVLIMRGSRTGLRGSTLVMRASLNASYPP